MAAEYPLPPDELGDGAKLVWMRHIKELVDSRGVIGLDLFMFAQLCRQAAIVDQMGRVCESEPIMVPGPRNRPMPNPILKEFDKALKQMQASFDGFGLTPQSRARIDKLRGSKEAPDADSKALASFTG